MYINRCFSVLFVVVLFSFVTRIYSIESDFNKERLDAFIVSYFGNELDEEIKCKPLTSGNSQAVLYHCMKGEKHYVLRFQDLANSGRLKECDMLEQASQEGIAPHVHHINRESGVILMDYINDGATLLLKEAHRPESVRALAHSLRIAHTIPKTTHPVNRTIDKVRDDYTTFENLGLVDESMKKMKLKTESLFKELEEGQYPQKMIHGDLHARNIFLTNDGRFFFIDWEDVQYDDPFFDLAHSAFTLNFNVEQELDYLSAYLGYLPDTLEWKHYLLCKDITRVGLHFHLLKKAYELHDNIPFIQMGESIQPWGWYVERFTEGNQKSSAEFNYNCAKSILYDANE